MIEDSNSIGQSSILHELDKIIKKWELFEKEYHDIINSKMDEYIKRSEIVLRKKIFSSQIIACSDGLFVIREANKHNISNIFTNLFQRNVQETRKEFNLNKLEHVKISNKVQFYSLDFFNYDQTNNYNVNSEALKDFQLLISNDNLVEDGYIRSLSDVIELGINQDFEKGQLIFRGEVNDEWELIPKLFREYRENADFYEMVLCETLLLGIKSPYSNTFDPIDLLMNLQHFGIPTRLLDWTSDLLVALFFACYDEKEEYNNKDGNLYAIQRSQYTPFKVNSSENNIFKHPINPNTLELFKKRLDINDIHVFEPVIKNPRLRIQDGCFMFFSFLPLDSTKKKYITFHDYMRAKNKYREQEKEENRSNIPEIFIMNKKVDKNYKKSILSELDEKYGISKQSLFVEIKHIESVSNYYKKLYERAKTKASLIISQEKDKKRMLIE